MFPIMTIYLLILRDEPVEVLSVWSTREKAEQDLQRLLETRNQRPRDYYWLAHRLSVEPFELDKEGIV